MSAITPAAIEHRFAFHAAPDQEKRDAHTSVRQACRRAADEIIALAPDCEETRIAVEKLEEAMFWGNAALARHS